jgi:hypothetical protein
MCVILNVFIFCIDLLLCAVICTEEPRKIERIEVTKGKKTYLYLYRIIFKRSSSAIEHILHVYILFRTNFWLNDHSCLFRFQ